nr:hypothetical protein [Tanacetum cinerariifolium]
MQTRSSSRFTRDQSSNPTSSTNTNPKGRNRRGSKQRVENSNLEEHLPPVVTMTNQSTMAELLRAPTEGYKDLLRACPHHGFTELHQLDTFYNALNPTDQDSLNAAAGGNLLERSTQDVLTIIKNKSKVRNSRSKTIVSQVKACDVSSNSEIAKLTHALNQQTIAVTTAMMAMLKQFQATLPLAPVKAVEEICVTCRGSGSLPSNTVANPKGELKAITTRSGLVIDGPSVPTPSQSINLEVDERVKETFTDPDLAEYTIKVPPPPTPTGIARDVFVPIGKFTFPADFVIADYESDLRMILHDGDERLTLNMRHDTSSYSNQPQKESINLINVFNNSSDDFLEDLFPSQPSGNLTLSPHPELTSPKVNNDIFDSEGCNVLSEKLPNLDSTKDLHPYFHDNPLSGSTTYFSNSLLEEFADELPPEYDDNLQFDIESDLKEIEFMLYQDKILMFTDEHTLDYSYPPIFDKYDDDFLEVESDAYDDPFDSNGEKIKEVDALPSTNNEDKIFNPGILIQEKPIEIITHVVQDKKLVISNASLVLEDFDPPFYEPFFFKEVPKSKMLLLFSSENEEKVFKPRIHTSKKVHSYFIPELSHQGYQVFKINQIFESLMKIFLFHCGKDTHILAVLYHHFYPLDQFKYGGIGSSSAT